MPNTARGFTLIEMAITVLVIGIIVSGTIGALTPFRDGQKTALTSQRLDIAQKALLLYAIQNGCLPCPAAPSATTAALAGRSQTTGGTYTTAAVKCVETAVACLSTASDTGVLPWRELGLSEDDATDGWGNRLRYHVAGSGTATPACPSAGNTLHRQSGMMRVTGTSGCYPTGNITVADIDIPETPTDTPPLGTTATTAAAYVVFSNGPDGALAHRAGTGTATGDRWTQSGDDSQAENSDGDSTFSISAVGNANSNDSHFDDLLRYASPAVIIQMCGANACGNPS